jgi:hypothetical protein
MIRSTLRTSFLPIVIIFLAISSTLVITQQTVRTLSDSQLLDISANLVQNIEKNPAVLQSIPQEQTVDPSKVNDIFLQIYNDDKTVQFSNLALEGAEKPRVPDGVLDFAKQYGKNTITWAPKKDTRLGITARRFGGEKPGYVLVGKSMRSTDALVLKILNVAGFAFLASTAIILAVSLLVSRSKKSPQSGALKAPIYSIKEAAKSSVAASIGKVRGKKQAK